ncbi:MAG: hypothetical protein K1060chlam1_01177 [Candidatus Anoxychlamydiales bacterium]|nr:hypothetical protein [Candidatus Anoxychlamydiales bacterium]
MATVAGKVIGGACAIAASVSIGGVLLGVRSKASQLEPEQRGSLKSRIQETVLATIKRREIMDKSVKAQHVDLVLTMSSRDYSENAGLSKKELSKINTSYFAGYLFETVETYESSTHRPHVFRFTPNLPVCLPKIDDVPYQGFVFSGDTSRIHDSDARQQILDGNYVRCSSVLPRKDSRSYDYRDEEVIIAGTTDCGKCQDFGKGYFKDFIMASAGMGRRTSIDPKFPLSDTPVLEIEGDKFKKVGDLAEFPESTKEKVRLMQYTLCPFYSLQKTRLSDGRYNEVGAVVAGAENSKVCEALHFGHIRELISAQKKS